MNREIETKKLQDHANRAWDKLCRINRVLNNHKCPIIVLNGRFTSSAGMCTYDEKVDISLKYYIFHTAHIIRDTLPHELIHQATFSIYGPESCEKLQGHGVEWCNLMKQYGLPDNRYHTLTIPKLPLSEMIKLWDSK